LRVCAAWENLNGKESWLLSWVWWFRVERCCCLGLSGQLVVLTLGWNPHLVLKWFRWCLVCTWVSAHAFQRIPVSLFLSLSQDGGADLNDVESAGFGMHIHFLDMSSCLKSMVC
jgi:hypothetical protein